MEGRALKFGILTSTIDRGQTNRLLKCNESMPHVIPVALTPEANRANRERDLSDIFCNVGLSVRRLTLITCHN